MVRGGLWSVLLFASVATAQPRLLPTEAGDSSEAAQRQSQLSLLLEHPPSYRLTLIDGIAASLFGTGAFAVGVVGVRELSRGSPRSNSLLLFATVATVGTLGVIALIIVAVMFSALETERERVAEYDTQVRTLQLQLEHPPPPTPKPEALRPSVPLFEVARF